MKIKSLLIAALAMVAFASCNKKDVIEAPQAADKTVTIRIHSGVTRAFEAPVADETVTEINEAIVYFLSGTTVLHKVEVKSTDIADLKAAAGKKFEKVPGSVDNVMILANNNAQVGAMTAGTQKAIEELAFTTAKENVGPGVAGITLLGKDVVKLVAGVNKAEVTVSPIVARIEVSGKIITTDGMKDLKVLGVYMDNYHTTYGDADTKKSMNKEELKLEDLSADNYPLQNLITADADHAALVGKTKVAAYHVFQKEAPIVVVKISYILNGTLVPEQYITLTKLQLKNATTDKYEVEPDGVKGGFIYQIDLAKVDWNGNGVFDKPQGVDPDKDIDNDPESPTYNPVDPKKPEPKGPDAFDPTMAGPKPHSTKKDIAVFAISNPWKTVEILPAL